MTISIPKFRIFVRSATFFDLVSGLFGTQFNYESSIEHVMNIHTWIPIIYIFNVLHTSICVHFCAKIISIFTFHEFPIKWFHWKMCFLYRSAVWCVGIANSKFSLKLKIDFIQMNDDDECIWTRINSISIIYSNLSAYVDSFATYKNKYMIRLWVE